MLSKSVHDILVHDIFSNFHKTNSTPCAPCISDIKTMLLEAKLESDMVRTICVSFGVWFSFSVMTVSFCLELPKMYACYVQQVYDIIEMLKVNC